MSERLAFAGLDDQVVDAGLLGTQVCAGEARLLAVREAMLDRHILDPPEILLRVAHSHGA
jgi:hypothetical protein